MPDPALLDDLTKLGIHAPGQPADVTLGKLKTAIDSLGYDNTDPQLQKLYDVTHSSATADYQAKTGYMDPGVAAKLAASNTYDTGSVLETQKRGKLVAQPGVLDTVGAELARQPTGAADTMDGGLGRIGSSFMKGGIRASMLRTLAGVSDVSGSPDEAAGNRWLADINASHAASPTAAAAGSMTETITPFLAGGIPGLLAGGANLGAQTASTLGEGGATTRQAATGGAVAGGLSALLGAGVGKFADATGSRVLTSTVPAYIAKQVGIGAAEGAIQTPLLGGAQAAGEAAGGNTQMAGQTIEDSLSATNYGTNMLLSALFRGAHAPAARNARFAADDAAATAATQAKLGTPESRVDALADAMDAHAADNSTQLTNFSKPTPVPVTVPTELPKMQFAAKPPAEPAPLPPQMPVPDVAEVREPPARPAARGLQDVGPVDLPTDLPAPLPVPATPVPKEVELAAPAPREQAEPLSADTPYNKTVWNTLADMTERDTDGGGFSVKTHAGEVIHNAQLDGDLRAVEGVTGTGEKRVVKLEDVAAAKLPNEPKGVAFTKQEPANGVLSQPVPAEPPRAASVRPSARGDDAAPSAPVARPEPQSAAPAGEKTAAPASEAEDLGHAEFRNRATSAERYEGKVNVVKETSGARLVGGISDFHKSPTGKFAVQEIPGKGFRVIQVHGESLKAARNPEKSPKSLRWDPVGSERWYPTHAEAATAAKAHADASRGAATTFLPRDAALAAQLRANRANSPANLGKGATADERAASVAGSQVLKSAETGEPVVRLGPVAKLLTGPPVHESQVDDISRGVIAVKQKLAPFKAQYPEAYAALDRVLDHVDGTKALSPGEQAAAYRALRTVDPTIPEVPVVDTANAPLPLDPLRLTEGGKAATDALAAAKPGDDLNTVLGHVATVMAEIPTDHPVRVVMDTVLPDVHSAFSDPAKAPKALQGLNELARRVQRASNPRAGSANIGDWLMLPVHIARALNQFVSWAASKVVQSLAKSPAPLTPVHASLGEQYAGAPTSSLRGTVGKYVLKLLPRQEVDSLDKTGYLAADARREHDGVKQAGLFTEQARGALSAIDRLKAPGKVLYKRMLDLRAGAARAGQTLTIRDALARLRRAGVPDAHLKLAEAVYQYFGETNRAVASAIDAELPHVTDPDERQFLSDLRDRTAKRADQAYVPLLRPGDYMVRVPSKNFAKGYADAATAEKAAADMRGQGHKDATVDPKARTGSAAASVRSVDALSKILGRSGLDPQTQAEVLDAVRGTLLEGTLSANELRASGAEGYSVDIHDLADHVPMHAQVAGRVIASLKPEYRGLDHNIATKVDAELRDWHRRLRESNGRTTIVARSLGQVTALVGLHAPLTAVANGWDTVSARMLAASIHPAMAGAAGNFGRIIVEPAQFMVNLARETGASLEGQLKGLESSATTQDVAKRMQRELAASSSPANKRVAAELAKSASGGYLKENAINAGESVLGPRTQAGKVLSVPARAALWGMRHSIRVAKVQTWVTGAQLFAAMGDARASWESVEKLGYRGPREMGPFADWFASRVGGEHGRNARPEALRSGGGAIASQFLGYSMNQMGVYIRLLNATAGRNASLETRARMGAALAGLIGASVIAGGALNGFPMAKTISDAYDALQGQAGAAADALERKFGRGATHSWLADLLSPGAAHDITESVGSRVGIGSFGGGVPGVSIPVTAAHGVGSIVAGLWKHAVGAPNERAQANDLLAKGARMLSPYGYKVATAINGKELRSMNGKTEDAQLSSGERVALLAGATPEAVQDAQKRAQVLAPKQAAAQRALASDIADALAEHDTERVQRGIREYQETVQQLVAELRTAPTPLRKAEIVAQLRELNPRSFMSSIKSQVTQRVVPDRVDMTRGPTARRALAMQLLTDEE
jgi:hypothetical protein